MNKIIMLRCEMDLNNVSDWQAGKVQMSVFANWLQKTLSSPGQRYRFL
jgi:hypothetical protein